MAKTKAKEIAIEEATDVKSYKEVLEDLASQLRLENLKSLEEIENKIAKL